MRSLDGELASDKEDRTGERRPLSDGLVGGSEGETGAP